jgi:hypothetical protein
MSDSTNWGNMPGTAVAVTVCGLAFGQGSENPLIKVTAAQTINASIESLQVLATMLDNTAKLATILAEIREEMPGAEVEKLLTVTEIAGLNLFISCVQSALAPGYGQSLSAETKTTGC